MASSSRFDGPTTARRSRWSSSNAAGGPASTSRKASRSTTSSRAPRLPSATSSRHSSPIRSDRATPVCRRRTRCHCARTILVSFPGGSKCCAARVACCSVRAWSCLRCSSSSVHRVWRGVGVALGVTDLAARLAGVPWLRPDVGAVWIDAGIGRAALRGAAAAGGRDSADRLLCAGVDRRGGRTRHCGSRSARGGRCTSTVTAHGSSPVPRATRRTSRRMVRVTARSSPRSPPSRRRARTGRSSRATRCSRRWWLRSRSRSAA
mgnify:CR=1 FL=1